jgi:hypothetical protein
MGAGQLAGQCSDRLPHGLLDQVRVAASGQMQQNVAGSPLHQGAGC